MPKTNVNVKIADNQTLNFQYDVASLTDPGSASNPILQPIGEGAATEETLSEINVKLPSLIDSRLPVQTRIAAEFKTGQKSIVNANQAIQLSDTSNPLPSGVLTVKASIENTAVITLGANSGLNLTNGFRLNPGEAIPIETSDLANVWIFAATANQLVSFIGW